MKAKMVLVFGTFDGLHKGHLNLLMQARKLGCYLVAVVARDITVKKVKGNLPKFSEQERLKELQKVEIVNEVRLGNRGNDPYKIIEEIKPDIICLGYDQIAFINNLEKEIEKFLPAGRQVKLKIEIVRLKPYMPKKYKSSILNKNNF